MFTPLPAMSNSCRLLRLPLGDAPLLVYDTKEPRHETLSQTTGSKFCGGNAYSSVVRGMRVDVALSQALKLTMTTLPGVQYAPEDGPAPPGHTAPTKSVSPTAKGNRIGVVPSVVHDALVPLVMVYDWQTVDAF